ncbi:beta-N-acetylhexosaminidase [Enterococcus saccharolyticus]|uniref:beta-N-acetylhexosaminidase n=1 Tax=Enterococcus TaxID=1350 RepID=UPI001E47C834|nr:beta-N-acetylhexosaminidase [Enterococcus saccharolyticus]MCD5001906.1 beta-N-acetylhexosaminidase [Enterococcus saccharolyticus]
MKAVYFTGDIDTVKNGLLILQKKLQFCLDESGTPIQLIHHKGPLICEKKIDKITLTFSEPAHLFRGLNLLFYHWETPDFSFTETPQFDVIGPMVDTSRNAVPTVEKIKELLETCSVIGLNQCLLYMEDTYEVTDYPYFGYFRGRYSAAELKEIDDYGHDLGIEVIPAIQVLAHLKNPLKWNFTRNFRDTEDILLVDEPKTYHFLAKAIQAVSQPFRTKKIHIGMDEAHQLGLGRFLQRHGLQNRFDLMNRHLTKVLEITDSLDLEVEMWSDMYFRLGSKTGDYYDPDVAIPQEVITEIPHVKMVYWDYYHHQESDYLQLLAQHKKLAKPIVFAGGIWTWNGLAPNYSKTIATTHAALSACKKQQISSVYATLWGDDGSETPLDSALYGLQLFAEHQFNQTVSNELVATRFLELQHESADSFLLLDCFDQTPGVAPENPEGSAVSKLILYQDPLLGLYDKTISEFPLTEHYQKLAKDLAQCQTSEKTADLFAYYQLLAEILAKKTSLGIHLQQIYLAQDKNDGQQILLQLEQLKNLIDNLRQSHRQLWFAANKAFGWEVLDIRYGGILTRLESSHWRITQWLMHDISLEELTETRLPFDGPYPMPEGIIGRNLYHGIVSPSKLSDV